MKKTEDRNVLQEYRRVRDELARKHPTPEDIHRDLLSLDDDRYVVIRGSASVKRKQNRKKPASATLPERRKKEV